jgi:glycine dehydrogenase
MQDQKTVDITPSDLMNDRDRFVDRHIGRSDADLRAMLEAVGVESLDELIDQTVPDDIRLTEPLDLPGPMGEFEALRRLESIALKNQIHRSYIGMGYYNTVTPAVIRRNILENPGWYTQYTPYQAEIAQGRLEVLLNFQTMVADLTGLPIANASLLDEATAAAEGMGMCIAAHRHKRMKFLVADTCHPQTINVCKTRAWSMGVDLDVCDIEEIRNPKSEIRDHLAGVLVQLPDTFGNVEDFTELARRVHDAAGRCWSSRPTCWR